MSANGASAVTPVTERARRAVAYAVALVALAPLGTTAAAQRGADGALRVRVADAAASAAWHAWWHPDAAPTRWSAASPALLRQLRWRATAPGVEVAELALSGAGEAWRVRAVLVRIDPARQRLALHADVRADGAVRPWSVASAPDAATVALNAGQFTDAGPWGWVMHAGRELQPPAAGPLSSAVVVDGAGHVRVVEADSVAALRATRGTVVEAVQSYPTLLVGDGEIPRALQANADAIDLAHRDARLAIGELRDGRVLVALTRFDALGATLGAVPLGLTVPETAALMGALGCRRAVMLDGGISAQLAVRHADGERRAWSGLRRVPLGIVAMPRDDARVAQAPPRAR